MSKIKFMFFPFLFLTRVVFILENKEIYIFLHYLMYFKCFLFSQFPSRASILFSETPRPSVGLCVGGRD